MWLKHADFTIDLLCLQLAFYIELTDLIIIFMFEVYKGVLKRGYYKEFVSYVKQAFMKRTMDIYAGLAGCILTGIIFIFIASIIYISSPGHIFFSQERVGGNGKTFKMYKFRSMYINAEERKAELMKENKISNKLMFKMDFDPRIIGNKILPYGTKKTGVGQFIRSTSLDEFSQFYNVLKGKFPIIIAT